MEKESKSKAETFIGFCIRARKCKIGTNACKTLKKAKLIIVCGSSSDNTKKEGKEMSVKFGCPLITCTSKTLEEMTFKENAKIMAITDEELSKAIIGNSNNGEI